MRLISIQVATPRLLRVGGREISTGIFKERVASAMVGRHGLDGDAVVNTKHHGGVDQAVYVYSQEDYDWWADQLDGDVFAGMFGENLTFSSFGPGDVMIGDRWRIGEAVLEATAPRLPCATFGAKMGDPGIVKRFRKAGRPGFYARVVAAGEATAGMDVTRIPSAHSVSILDLFDLAYDTSAGTAELERVLAAPIAGACQGRLWAPTRAGTIAEAYARGRPYWLKNAAVLLTMTCSRSSSDRPTERNCSRISSRLPIPAG